MTRLRKGELVFYKSSSPKELKKYIKNHPENQEYVEEFLSRYRYNYVKKTWLLNEE